MKFFLVQAAIMILGPLAYGLVAWKLRGFGTTAAMGFLPYCFTIVSLIAGFWGAFRYAMIWGPALTSLTMTFFACLTWMFFGDIGPGGGVVMAILLTAFPSVALIGAFMGRWLARLQQNGSGIQWLLFFLCAGIIFVALRYFNYL